METLGAMEDWGNSQGKDLSLAAFVRLREIELGRGAASSALCIRKELMQTQSLSHPHFVPFLRERDHLGHLISLNSPPPASTRTFKSPQPTLPREHSLERIRKPLGTMGKLQIPSVGTYRPTNYTWTRTEFAIQRKNKQGSEREKGKKTEAETKNGERRGKSELIPTFQHSVKRRTPVPKPKDPYDILRPEVFFDSIKPTNFQSVHIDDSPDAIRASIQWPERRRLKDDKLSTLMRVMAQFRKGKLFD